MSSVSIVVVATVDHVLRDVFAASAICDLPDVVVLRHDVAPGQGGLRRLVYDGAGIVETARLRLDHTCLACALRDDILLSLDRVAAAGRWNGVVVALPVGTEPEPVVRGVNALLGVAHGQLAERVVGAVVSLLDARTVMGDLFGDDLLVERGMAFGDGDRRAVGEALAHQIDYADLVVPVQCASGHPAARSLLCHLAGDRLLAGDGVESIEMTDLFRRRHDSAAAAARADPCHARPQIDVDRADDAAAWTLDLRSERPFHPERLWANLCRLAAGRLRGRGRFWLPTRPESRCAWDGAGGQLSIGTVGTWGERRDTRLVVTGMDDPVDVRAAFAASLVTDSEWARGTRGWRTQDDGLDTWLGIRPDAA